MRLNARLPCIISDAVEVIGIGDRAGVMCVGGGRPVARSMSIPDSHKHTARDSPLAQCSKRKPMM